MQGYIGFEQYKIRCLIGVNPEEKIHPQEIFVDLKVRSQWTACAQSDRLQDTIDYVRLASICRQQAESHVALLEMYSCNVLEEIFATFNVDWAWIKVKKPQALPLADFAFVELERYR